MKKLAIITTHPIQYNAPFFKLLTERGKVKPKAFYTWPQAIEGFEDKDFGKTIQWDIPLLEGYEWEDIENMSKNPNSKSWKGIDCPDLIKMILDFHPDAILVYGWNLKSHFNVMKYFKGKVPIWFTGDSTLLDEKSGWRKVVRRIWLRWVYRYVDKAFYVGKNNLKYFQVHGLKEDQLVSFPHAIDNDRFADNEECQYESAALKWRNELGYADDDVVVLFAGKFETKKNPTILIEAIQQLNQPDRQIGSQIKLLLVGNGPLEKELIQMAKGDKSIQFLPFQNQSVMPVLYRLGDFFCLPSKGPSETWGLAVNEAMASSRPVVVSNRVGCAEDLIVDDITGKVFTFNQVNELEDALLDLIYLDNERIREKCFDYIQTWNFTNKCTSIEEEIEIN